MILHAVFLAWLGEYDATNLHCFLRFCVRVHRWFVDWSGIGFLFVGEVCKKMRLLQARLLFVASPCISVPSLEFRDSFFSVTLDPLFP